MSSLKDVPSWLVKASERQLREEEEMILVERARVDKEKFDFEKLSSLHDVNERWGKPRDQAAFEKQLERDYYLDHTLTSMAAYADCLTDRNIYD